MGTGRCRACKPMYESVNDYPIYAGAARSSAAGYSLIEIMIGVVIISIVSAIVIPQYFGAVNAARIAQAIADIRAISAEIDIYYYMTFV